MATLDWALQADLDKNGSYETDLTQYVDMPGQDIRVGMGAGRDGRSRTSLMSFTLSNWDGAFTVNNPASAFYGKLRPGVPVRLVVTVEGVTYTAATMYAMEWLTSHRAGKPSQCNVRCEDIIWYLMRGAPIRVTASETRTSADAINAVLDAVGLETAARDIGVGQQPFPMHVSVIEKPMDALQAAAASEMGGQLYPNGLGQLRFEGRHERVGIVPPDATWGAGTDINPWVEDYLLAQTEACTAVTVRATHFHTGQADTVIWEDTFNMFTNPASSRVLGPGEVYERTYQPNSAYVALTALEAVKDYLANAAADGTGIDKTALLEMTLTDHGGVFTLRRRNLSATETVYVTKAQVRGQPVEFYADQSIVQVSLAVPWQPSIISIEFDVPFAGDQDGKFQDYAYQELRVGRYPWPTLRLTFKAVLLEQVQALLAVDIGHLVRYASPNDLYQSAMVDDWWRVEAIDYTVPSGWAGEWFDCAVTLIPADTYRNLDAIAYDEFDRADTVSGLGRSTSNDTWAEDSSMAVVSGAAVPTSTGTTSAVVYVGESDQVVEVQLADLQASVGAGVLLRWAGPDTYYHVFIEKTSGVWVTRSIAGVSDQIAMAEFTVGTAHELRAMVQGGRIRVWVDGVLYVTVVDSLIASGDWAGLMGFDGDVGWPQYSHFYAQGLSVTPAPGEATMAMAGGVSPAMRRRRRSRP